MTSTMRLASPAAIAAALLVLGGGTPALAQDATPPAMAVAPAAVAESAAAPNNTVRVGMYFVHYSASAPDLSGPFTPAHINLTVENVNTPYFAYLRRLDPHWSLELAAGIPPTTHTLGKGPPYLGSVPFDGQQVATAKWFSPSFLVEYNFRSEQEKFRPYVGAGFNYTHFYERNSTAAGDAANGGPTSTRLSNSIGPAATAGLSYKFTREINAIASYSFARVNSDYDSDTAGIHRTTKVHFNPRTLVIAVGYSF